MGNVKRLDWIDMAKGFAIICMLISHAIPEHTNPIKNWITAFNMPLFFLLSGFLKEETNKKYNISDFGLYLKKKLIILGIPYVVFCLLYTFLMVVLSLYSSGWSPTTINKLIGGLKNTFFFLGVQSMWFIPVYFYSVLIYDFLIFKIKGGIKAIIIVTMVMLLLLKQHLFVLNLFSRQIGKVIEALVFLQVGSLSYQFRKKTNILITTISLICFSVLAIWNDSVSMNFEFGIIPPLFFINAAALSVTLCYLFRTTSHYLPQTVQFFLSTYGQYSIVILVTNNIVIEIARLLDHKLTGSFFLHHGIIGHLLFAAFLVLLEYPVILAAKGKAGILFGKGKQQ